MLAIGAANGIGIHQQYLSPENIENGLLFGWMNQVLALVAIGLGKVAIVVFLLQIQGYQTPARSTFLWIIAGSGFIVNLLAAILAIVQSSPVTRLWDIDAGGSCPGRLREKIFGYIQGCKFSLF